MSGIQLRAPVMILFFLIKISPLMASIDGGAPFKANWDGNAWHLPPGPHRLQVWFKYFGFVDMGRADSMIDVPAGGMVNVEYKHPWLVFLPGKFRVLGASGAPVTAGQVAQAAPGAGWHPDPTGKFEQRYWDGSGWTDHVSTGGVASADPMPR
jgi:hypothetical protein